MNEVTLQVGGKLGGKLFIDLTEDGPAFEVAPLSCLTLITSLLSMLYTYMQCHGRISPSSPPTLTTHILLRPAPTYTIHPPPYNLHLTPFTLHPAPYTLHFTPTPCTPKPTPCNPHPAPYTSHPTHCLLRGYLHPCTRLSYF